MFDAITQSYLKFAKENFAQCLWRMLRLVNKDVDVERRELFRNLICSLPGKMSQTFEREISWVEREGLNESLMFPYERVKSGVVGVEGFDSQRRLPFVIHNNRRLYFPKGYGDLKAAYESLVNDEGLTGEGIREKSPHAYVGNDFDLSKGDVLLDVGCAEALFALDKVDVAQKVYLFEGLQEWKKPLAATFDPYVSKTKITLDYVGDGTGGTVRLQDVVTEPPGTTYFVKMDIEGAERSVLRASAAFLKNNRVKLSCCVYHRQDDAEVIARLLSELGFTCVFSDGWMLPDCNGFHFPYFRHGVIRAQNF